MRFLADENFPGAAVVALKGHGHDVVSVGQRAYGLPDIDVFAWAVEDDRIILTFDKDFGEIARQTTGSADCGVILFRVSMPSPAKAADDLADTINARSDWAGYFSVITTRGVRRWPLKQH